MLGAGVKEFLEGCHISLLDLLGCQILLPIYEGLSTF